MGKPVTKQMSMPAAKSVAKADGVPTSVNVAESFNELACQLAPHYAAFKVSERILLTGHSHQAWPDIAKHGMLQCFEDAACHIDDKWGLAFTQAERVREFYRGLLGEAHGQIALGASTHELILRFLSDLNWSKAAKQSASKPINIVTTDGEFHSLRRQLHSLKSLNINIISVPVAPLETLASRIIDELNAATAAVIVSAVFFETSVIFSDVGRVALAAKSLGIPCLVDAYHALNVVPFNLELWQLESAFIVAGGYKYCQAGEGNCMLRIPPDYHGRPLITGWFAEFDVLNQAVGEVNYGRGQAAFAGSTYDPCSHYRAAVVFDFFKQQQLSDIRLCHINQQQIKLLWQGIDSMALAPEVLCLPTHSISANGGFISLVTPKADAWVEALKQRGISSDSRGQHLRLGPAPYVTKNQLEQALHVIEDVAKQVSEG
ncbi:MAG: kynureninase [Shewanella sp.]